MYIESIDGAEGNQVAQFFQRRAHQCCAAIAFIDELQLGMRRQSVLGEALAQSCQLTGDGIGSGLLFVSLRQMCLTMNIDIPSIVKRLCRKGCPYRKLYPPCNAFTSPI